MPHCSSTRNPSSAEDKTLPTMKSLRLLECGMPGSREGYGFESVHHNGHGYPPVSQSTRLGYPSNGNFASQFMATTEDLYKRRSSLDSYGESAGSSWSSRAPNDPYGTPESTPRSPTNLSTMFSCHSLDENEEYAQLLPRPSRGSSPTCSSPRNGRKRSLQTMQSPAHAQTKGQYSESSKLLKGEEASPSPEETKKEKHSHKEKVRRLLHSLYADLHAVGIPRWVKAVTDAASSTTNTGEPAKIIGQENSLIYRMTLEGTIQELISLREVEQVKVDDVMRNVHERVASEFKAIIKHYENDQAAREQLAKDAKEAGGTDKKVKDKGRATSKRRPSSLRKSTS